MRVEALMVSAQASEDVTDLGVTPDASPTL